MAAGAQNLFGYQQLSKVPTVGAPKLSVLGSGSLLPSGITSGTATLGGITQPSSGGLFGDSTPSVIGSDSREFGWKGKTVPSPKGSPVTSVGGAFAPGAWSSFNTPVTEGGWISGWRNPYVGNSDAYLPYSDASLSAVTSPNYDSSVFTQDEVDKIAAERKTQEKINEEKKNKMMELATMGDDTPQTSIGRPLMLGEGNAIAQHKSIAHGSPKRRKGKLDSFYFEGLYPKSSGGIVS
jgi:hypothetical protein